MKIGTVQEVYELGPTDLLEVSGGKGTLMIPYQPEIVVNVDVGASRIVIDPPDGLLDL